MQPVSAPGRRASIPVATGDFFGDGVSNQTRLAFLAEKVRLLQFSPHTFSFFYFKGVVYFVSFMFIKKLIV